MYKLSEHLTYSEATVSQQAKRFGIKNEPNPSQLMNMVTLAKNVFEPVRTHFNVPIYVSSMFRSKLLNEKINGSETSQHCANNGAAMDLDADVFGKIQNVDIFLYIKDNVDFDQLIWEFGDGNTPDWVHVSYVSKEKNRKEVLVSYYEVDSKTGKRKTKYKYYKK